MHSKPKGRDVASKGTASYIIKFIKEKWLIFLKPLLVGVGFAGLVFKYILISVGWEAKVPCACLILFW